MHTVPNWDLKCYTFGWNLSSQFLTVSQFTRHLSSQFPELTRNFALSSFTVSQFTRHLSSQFRQCLAKIEFAMV